MAKLFELPTEQSICCIPLKHAVYCRACRTVSNSRPHECGLCGSRKVIRLEAVLSGNPDPPAQSCRAAGISLVTAVGACRRHSAEIEAKRPSQLAANWPSRVRLLRRSPHGKGLGQLQG
jgi:hypothetical protein